MLECTQGSLEALGFERYVPGRPYEHQEAQAAVVRASGRARGLPLECAYDTVTITRKT